MAARATMATMQECFVQSTPLPVRGRFPSGWNRSQLKSILLGVARGFTWYRYADGFHVLGSAPHPLRSRCSAAGGLGLADGPASGMLPLTSLMASGCGAPLTGSLLGELESAVGLVEQ